jgi:hypothetical protein
MITISTALTVQASAGTDTESDPELEQTASHMAREFSAATTEIVRLIGEIKAQTDRLDATFCTDAHSRFSMDLMYFGHRYNLDAENSTKISKEMERRAWSVLVDKLGIKNVMSVAKRKEFDEQLLRGELPPVNEQTILGILLGFTNQAQDFAKEAALEVFNILRPPAGWGGQYATNNAFRVGRRVILPHRVELNWGGTGFRVEYYREQELTAIDGIFHLLAGQGVMRENKGPLISAINSTDRAGRGETEYFRFKCYKNRNLHLEFKNLDLVKQLNFLAAGERVLGEDVG